MTESGSSQAFRRTAIGLGLNSYPHIMRWLLPKDPLHKFH